MIWLRPELQVLFVCTANICRSPLAEGMLRHRLDTLGLAKRVRVRSAGTHAIQGGCRPDPRVEELAAEAGISLAGIRSQILTPKLVRSSHYVLVMEHRHLQDVARVVADDEQCAEKIQLLGSFLHFSQIGVSSTNAPNTSAAEIPDPYFGAQQGFYNVFQMIDSALSGFLVCLAGQLKAAKQKP